MAVRRPKGQLHDTAAGSDTVAGAAPAGRPGPGAPGARDAADQGVDAGHLDDREQRQKATRKPAGPSGKRITDADVLVDGKARRTPTTPTEPG